MSEPIRLVHTADIHIGMENYGRWNPATGLHARLEDYLASLDQVVAHALKWEADVFLIAGDIYKSKDPSPTQQREFARRVRRLTSEGIQVVLLVGNHDQPNRHGDANPLDIYASLELPGVTIFRKPGLETLATRRGPLQIAGIPHLPRSYLMAHQQTVPRSLADAERLLEGVIDETLAALAEAVEPDVPAVLTAHLSIDTATLGSEQALMLGKGLTLPREALCLPQFDYVAMGHVHKPQIIGDKPSAVYPGSLDRIDFGEEKDDKGFYAVSVSRGEVALERVGIDVRPFRTVRVDLCDAADPTAELLAAIARQPLEGAVVRLAYVLQAERANSINEEAVREALAGTFDVVWRPELIPGTVRSRHPELNEAVVTNPLAALEKYLGLRPELEGSREALLAKAAELLEETPA
ncbi:MAG TPA: exonuclease SbcCD subunit D [Oscillatoriaceae cyanobacterium]